MAKLIGMKAIIDHENVSGATILKWVRDLGYPARKAGGIWLSDTESIDRWRQKYVEGKI